MALDEFFAIYQGFKNIFFYILKKVAHQLIFLPPFYSNFEFSCLQHKTVIIYMLFNILDI